MTVSISVGDEKVEKHWINIILICHNWIPDSGLALSIVGGSYDGVGVNDVIMSAKRSAYQAASKI